MKYKTKGKKLMTTMASYLSAPLRDCIAINTTPWHTMEAGERGVHAPTAATITGEIPTKGGGYVNNRR
jgi:hypothetical protein